jgi:hypothetical protein
MESPRPAERLSRRGVTRIRTTHPPPTPARSSRHFTSLCCLAANFLFAQAPLHVCARFFFVCARSPCTQYEIQKPTTSESARTVARLACHARATAAMSAYDRGRGGGANAAYQACPSPTADHQRQHPPRLSRVLWSEKGLSIGSVLDSAFELGEALFRRRTPHVSLDWTSGFVCGGQRWRVIAAPEHLIEEAARPDSASASVHPPPQPREQRHAAPATAGRAAASHPVPRPQSAHAPLDVPSTIAEDTFHEQADQAEQPLDEDDDGPYDAAPVDGEEGQEEEPYHPPPSPPARSTKAGINPNLVYYAAAGHDRPAAASYYPPQPRNIVSGVHGGYAYPASAQRQATPGPTAYPNGPASRPQPRHATHHHDSGASSRPAAASAPSSVAERPAVPATRASMTSSAAKASNGAASQARRSEK